MLPTKSSFLLGLEMKLGFTSLLPWRSCYLAFQLTCTLQEKHPQYLHYRISLTASLLNYVSFFGHLGTLSPLQHIYAVLCYPGFLLLSEVHSSLWRGIQPTAPSWDPASSFSAVQEVSSPQRPQLNKNNVFWANTLPQKNCAHNARVFFVKKEESCGQKGCRLDNLGKHPPPVDYFWRGTECCTINQSDSPKKMIYRPWYKNRPPDEGNGGMGTTKKKTTKKKGKCNKKRGQNCFWWYHTNWSMSQVIAQLGVSRILIKMSGEHVNAH